MLTYNFNLNHVEKKSVRNKEKMNLHRAIMIQDWMEKKSTSRISHFMMNSTTSTSSESPFSSSETDTKNKPRHNIKRSSEKKSNRKGGIARTTKIRALLEKYGETNKKVKQPISPGSRIATFISSNFNNSTRNNVKKTKKMCYVGEDVMSFEHKYSISKSLSSSPCFSSTASSFSIRSCMNKTPRKSNNNNGTKRCVRFYPFSIILGEEDYYSHPHSVRKMTTSTSIKDIMKKDSKEKCVEAASPSSCSIMKG